MPYCDNCGDYFPHTHGTKYEVNYENKPYRVIDTDTGEWKRYCENCTGE